MKANKIVRTGDIDLATEIFGRVNVVSFAIDIALGDDGTVELRSGSLPGAESDNVQVATGGGIAVRDRAVVNVLQKLCSYFLRRHLF